MRGARYMIAAGVLAVGMTAHAQTQVDPRSPEATPIFLPSTSSYYNQQGFNLPSQTRASGQDIIRGSGGISCQSAVSGGGPTLDMGVIGTEDPFGRDSASLYGRVTIPLGKKPKRVDCTRLYEMELERLKLELDVLRQAQAPRPMGGPPADPWASGYSEPFEPEGFAPPAFQLGDLAPSPEENVLKVASADGEPRYSAARGHTVDTITTPDTVAGARAVTGPAGPLCPEGDIIVLRGDGSRACGPHLTGHTVQIAAFSSTPEARAAWESMADDLRLPKTSIAISRPRHLRTRTLQALQIARLSEQQARTLCADLAGECIIRHEG